MKEQLKKLNELGIDLDLFYVVTIREYGIDLQGLATEKTLNLCSKFVSFKFINDHNWLAGSKDGINITLTLK